MAKNSDAIVLTGLPIAVRQSAARKFVFVNVPLESGPSTSMPGPGGGPLAGKRKTTTNSMVRLLVVRVSTPSEGGVTELLVSLNITCAACI
jgi:hypothetical protein